MLGWLYPRESQVKTALWLLNLDEGQFSLSEVLSGSQMTGGSLCLRRGEPSGSPMRGDPLCRRRCKEVRLAGSRCLAEHQMVIALGKA